MDNEKLREAVARKLYYFATGAIPSSSWKSHNTESYKEYIAKADQILSLLEPKVLSDEEITAVESIYRTQVTSDQEWFNNPARQMQLMAIAYRAGKQSQATIEGEE